MVGSVSNPLLQALLQLPRTPRLSVLAYHRVMAEFDPLRPSEPTAAEFDARMRWVAANFNVLPLAAAVRALAEDRMPKRALCITFDDGYADNHDLALPILRRHGLPATFFVATGYLDGGCMFNDAVIEAVRQMRAPILDLEDLGFGRHPVHNDVERNKTIGNILQRLKYFEPGRREDVTQRIVERAGAAAPVRLMMSTQQVSALHSAHMEIGAHTVTHPILAKIGLDAARQEIERGRERLEEIIGDKVRLFAYPNGRPLQDYRGEHVALARQLGFEAAVSAAWGAARAGDDQYQIPRFTPWDRTNWRFGLRLVKNVLANQIVRA
jgi:peptidoglycan/xylan/chitin deacetylase (PgdA/CDA1 family)